MTPKQMVELYYEELFHWACPQVKSRQDAEDLVQEVFARALKCLQAAVLENPRAFLFRIARNILCDSGRRPDRHVFLDFSTSAVHEEITELQHTANAAVIAQAKCERVVEALDKLDPYQRALIIQIYFEDCSYEELHQKYRIAVGTLRVNVHRAIDELRKLLANLND